MTDRRAVLRIALALAMLAALAAACGPANGGVEPTDRGITLRVETPPQPTTGPFIVVAVDNHFHDIHYAERNLISQDRPFGVRNEGHNLHNFTVIGTGISIDIRPGREFLWARLGDVLKPGTYQVVCTYHDYVGMRGHFTVTP
ncbi:MAG TPA: hypothetical protein VGB19_11720 [Actinomycetota bacterium]